MPGRAGRRAKILAAGRTRDRGAAAVEMALVLPMLLFVVFGLIDFGRMLNTQLTLTEAAREGARAAALGQNADARVQAASTNLRGVTDSVTPCPAGGSTPPGEARPMNRSTRTRSRSRSICSGTAPSSRRTDSVMARATSPSPEKTPSAPALRRAGSSRR